jgi:soluble lytic murein transglycosylase
MGNRLGCLSLVTNKVPGFILIAALCFPAYGDMPENKSNDRNSVSSLKSYSKLKTGKELMDRGDYSEALENLAIAYEELPVMGDYTLFFMAKAYNKLSRFDDSSRSVSELLDRYPDSLLRKRARALEIRNILAKSGGKLQKDTGNDSVRYIEQYVKDCPEDAETSFMFGQLLKNIEYHVSAKQIFKQIYIANNSISEAAFRELQPSDITADDMISKASNYIKSMEYKRAENILRKTFLAANSSLHGEVHRKLGLALFRQKRYKEAAEEYLKAHDLYNTARSYYRNGDTASFSAMLSELVAMEDKRAGSLLEAQALRMRREGRTGEALRIYHDIKEKYPMLREDALWGIAWTYYRNGDCQRSLEVLSELNDKYPGTKYRYWQQKCSEQETVALSSDKDKDTALPEIKDEAKASAKSAAGGQAKKMTRNDFYGLLLYVRDIGRLGAGSVNHAAWSPAPGRKSQSNMQPPAGIQAYLERFDMLLDLNMREDAVNELVHVSKKLSKPEVIMYMSRKLQEAEAYKNSIGLVSRTSKEDTGEYNKIEKSGIDINDILYPIAYWSTVKEVSGRYRVDPFIILSVMREESRFDPDARSVAGALGLMQIMPQTAHNLDKKLKMAISDNSGIYDVTINITIGAYYLSSLLKEFGSLPVALAAYNAGEHKVREWLKEGKYSSYDEFIEDIPYDETKKYVKRVLLTYAAYLDIAARQ